MSLISGIVIVASGNSFHSVYIQLTHMELPARKPKQVDTSSLSEMEIIRDISYLKGIRYLDQMGSPHPSSRMTVKCEHQSPRLLEQFWGGKEITKDWWESVVVPIYRKGDRQSCENHTESSLVTASKLLFGIILHRLTRTYENVCDRDFIDQLFPLRQSLQHGHNF